MTELTRVTSGSRCIGWCHGGREGEGHQGHRGHLHFHLIRVLREKLLVGMETRGARLVRGRTLGNQVISRGGLHTWGWNLLLRR